MTTTMPTTITPATTLTAITIVSVHQQSAQSAVATLGYFSTSMLKDHRTRIFEIQHSRLRNFWNCIYKRFTYLNYCH